MLYLVRLPDLSASIVRAKNERDLKDLLRQAGDPDSCTWSVYDGPLWVDFSPKVHVNHPAASMQGARPLLADEIEFDGVEELIRTFAPMQVLNAPCSTGSERRAGTRVPAPAHQDS